MRIYSNPYELMSETARNLYEMGNEVKPRTYQNKVIEGKDDFITKELICEQYCLTHLEDPAPLFVFTKSKDWAEAEFQERIHPGQINPGEAWKLRPEIWEEFLVDGKYFDYTYSERMNEVVRYNGIVMTKLQAVIGLLKDDNDTRKAILNIYGEDGQVSRAFWPASHTVAHSCGTSSVSAATAASAARRVTVRMVPSVGFMTAL